MALDTAQLVVPVCFMPTFDAVHAIPPRICISKYLLRIRILYLRPRFITASLYYLVIAFDILGQDVLGPEKKVALNSCIFSY